LHKSASRCGQTARCCSSSRKTRALGRSGRPCTQGRPSPQGRGYLPISSLPTSSVARCATASCDGRRLPRESPLRGGSRPSPFARTHDYGVACQSKTKASLAPRFLIVLPAEGLWKCKQRAVSIDYSRSCWRRGGNPSVGRNRRNRVEASEKLAPGAWVTRSPPLDSRCLAFPCRS
jgi:hypothetical protein